ncbi:MAG TPA: SGNH/GDSL hydrolase family protein [Planctomycetaceae bacterium]|jgi:lysophospholipase L1-like esterase|nr:SGNH/GDSL hydrolase family protein [Planctomycetaceae bacterium]
MRICVLLALAMMSTMPGLAADPTPEEVRAATIRQLPALHLRQPPWASPTVYRESTVLLQEKDGAPLVGRLAFPTEEILAVKSADGTQTFTVGKDCELGLEKRTLIFPATAPVKFIKQSELFVPTGSPDSYKHRVGHPEQSLMYHTGSWFHDRQIEVTYRRSNAVWSGPKPALAEKVLPRTFARLKAGQPLTLGVSGDSISAGGDASGMWKFAPHMPAFPELAAAQLQQAYRSPITLKNRAVGGWSIANGNADLDKLLEEKPHLIIVAYGMNDVGRRNPGWFREQNKSLLDRIQAAAPETEIILVAPMLGNAEWVHTPREMFAAYRDVLQELTGPGIALADLTAVWTELLQHKHDLDLIGNGLNHPNDCGHRLYAQTILGLLVTPE